MQPAEASTPPSVLEPSRRAPRWKPGQSGNPAGRARKRVSHRLLPLIEEMAARGCTQEHIALACQMSPPTWQRCRDEDQAVADALLRGRSQLRDELVSGLIEKARKGDGIAAMFLLKALYHVRDQGPVDAEARPAVIINLPAALPMAAYTPKLIEHEGKRIE